MKLDSEKLARVYKKIVLSNGLMVVLIDAPTNGTWPKADCYLNIYCVNSKNEIVWQITAPVPKFDTDSFVSLELEGDTLSASRFFGAEFRVNIQTGIAEEIGWHK